MSGPASVVGLILAAGKSERMGTAKALLSFESKNFLQTIFDEALSSELSRTLVVLGHDAELIMKRLPQVRRHAVINADYEEGQLSSLQAGIRSLSGNDCDGVMVFLVDHPFVKRTLVNSLIHAFQKTDCSIVIPSCKNRRGHPMIFGSTLFTELLSAPLGEGAVAVVRKHEQEILHLEVEDESILVDIDTPAAYKRWVGPSKQ